MKDLHPKHKRSISLFRRLSVGKQISLRASNWNDEGVAYYLTFAFFFSNITLMKRDILLVYDIA